jgi:PilZ domain
MAHDRRRALRCPLIASAEVIELQTNTHRKARILDLSLVGCYVDMTNPLPVGVEVSLHITHSDVRFAALGVIAYCRPNTGMGVRFTDVQLDQHEILEKWLAALESQHRQSVL